MINPFQANFSPWWMLAPIAVIICALLVAIRIWRVRWLTRLAVVSALLAVFCGGALVATWNTQFNATTSWARLEPDGTWRKRQVQLQVACDQLRFSFWEFEYEPQTGWKWEFGHDLRFVTSYRPYDKRPLLSNRRFSLTKSDFIEKTLGLQLCWWRGNDAPTTGLYSITVPLWLLLALSLILPAGWLKRYLWVKRKARRGFPVGDPAHADPDSPQATSSTPAPPSSPPPPA